jgi:hypothetical protein
MAFTAEQFRAITTTERAVSVLSMVGSFFIMGTFLRWHYFRKPINRLVFYASFGNVMANIATLISTSALPVANEDPSALCQFQGVLIQWYACSPWLSSGWLTNFRKVHDGRFALGMPLLLQFCPSVLTYSGRCFAWLLMSCWSSFTNTIRANSAALRSGICYAHTAFLSYPH